MTDDTLMPEIPQDDQSLEAPAPPKPTKRKNSEWRSSIEACKNYKKKLIPNWSISIDFRRGKPYSSSADTDRITVPIDWSLTKAKEASLFSQVPKVRVNHPPQTIQAPWVHAFETRLNDTLVTAGIETAMEECLPDCINAAGFGVVLVSHEVINDYVEIVKNDLSIYPPELQAQIKKDGFLPDGTPLEVISLPRALDRRYKITRISPSDALFPINFSGANFDDAPWKGRTGRATWVQAKQLFPKLKDEDKSKVCGDGKLITEKLVTDTDQEKSHPEDEVEFDEIFYNEFEYNSEAKSYSTIHRLVFVRGIDEPVIDEPWTGQRINEETGEIYGSLKCPIRFLTLTYITDETIPPSDSAIGRPQVEEINKSRTQMIQQRVYSYPVRWFNSDRVDHTIASALMRGTWQHMIPVQGNGDGIIGEVARSSYPTEDFSFDNIAKSDLQESWSIGPNQMSSFGEGRQSASESKIVQSNYDTRNAKDRSKVAKFTVSIAEVLGGLLSIFEDPASFGEGFDPSISRGLAYSILADSTVVQDTHTRRETIKDFINFTAKSGFVELEPVLKEFATLSGLDPNLVIRPPQPAPPADPQISFRLSGAQDLMNPLALAQLLKSGQAADDQMVEKAKAMIASIIPFVALIKPVVSDEPMQDPTQQQQVGPDGKPMPPPDGPDGGPSGPNGAPPAPASPPPPSGPPMAPPTGPPGPPPGPMGPPTPNSMAAPVQQKLLFTYGAGAPLPDLLTDQIPIPSPPPPQVGQANPNWGPMERINKRVMDKEE